MNVSLSNLLISDYYALWMIITLCLSAFISYNTYPIIIKISKLKGLMQEPKDRSAHIVKTPNLGGIGIFIGVISTLAFVGSILSYNNLLCLIGASILLFFTGLKDDLVEISPINKLLGQVIASLGVIIISDVRIHNLYGVFGIEFLPYLVSIIFTLFVFVLLINAFNLIDGVDGLAGSIAIVSSIIFGILFYCNGNDSMLFISLSLIGSIATFLVFNFSKTQKLFMGDTGSMILGFLLAYQGISFLRMDHNAELTYAIPNVPILIIAIFSFPLMDTLRVFIIRIIKRSSPFSADKNHIHHNLLALGLKHWQISIIASMFVLILIFTTLYFNEASINVSLLSLLIVAFVFSIIPSLIIKFKKMYQERGENLSHNFTKTFKNLNKNPKINFDFQRLYNSILNIFISIIIYFNM